LTDKQALVAAIYDVGAGEVYTIAQSLAAAIGAGVPIADASGTGIFHLGEGVAEAAVLSLSSIVTCKTSYAAGRYLKDHMRYSLSQVTQTDIAPDSMPTLMQAFSLDPAHAWKLPIVGKDRITGRPSQVIVQHQMVEVLREQMFSQWIELLEGVFRRIPAALTTDILDKGLLLSGGLAQLHGLEARLATALNVPVATVEQPELVVIHGIGTALDHLDLFKESSGYNAS
jgi:rod shape-determining protein MreB